MIRHPLCEWLTRWEICCSWVLLQFMESRILNMLRSWSNRSSKSRIFVNITLGFYNSVCYDLDSKYKRFYLCLMPCLTMMRMPQKQELLLTKWVFKCIFSFSCSLVLFYYFLHVGFEIESIHSTQSPIESVKTAQAFFIGGGNTFLLLKTLYDLELLEPIRQRVLQVIW